MAKDRISFEISGVDFDKLKKFKKQHEHCISGTAGDKLSYTFVPTALGLAATIKCSCGRDLLLGNFMDHETGEYDEAKYRPLTKDDLINQKFEEAVQRILMLENPRTFRVAFRKDQSFDLIYAFAIGIAQYADPRVSKSILYKLELDEMHSEHDNYTGTDAENISKFFEHFKKNVLVELDQYHSENEKLRLACTSA